MTVVGIHPEELLDRLEQGELTAAEQGRLHAHLQGCGVCRFELALRRDFQADPVRSKVPPKPSPRRPRRPLVWALTAALVAAATGAFASAAVTLGTGKSVLDWLGAASGSGSGLDAAGANGRRTQPTLPPVPACCADSSSPKAAKSAAMAAIPEHSGTPSVRSPDVPARGDLPAGTLRRRAAANPSGSAGPTRTNNGAVGLEASGTALPPTASDLFRAAVQARRGGDLGHASELHRRLQSEFPGSPEAVLSRMTYATLLLDIGNAGAALAEFDLYLSQPKRPLEAEALVGRARALGRLGRTEEEARTWREVQQKYPASVYARRASERLAALGRL